MASRPLTHLRALCLALPEAEERETWDVPTFRVRGKIFAIASGRGGGLAVWLKVPPGAQAVLVGADPARFFAPPYLGPRGWVGMRLAPPPDRAELAALIHRSYRLVPPKRLAARLAEAG